MTKHFTKADFDQAVIEASQVKPALVDFFAAWCGPCQVMGPLIDELTSMLADKAIVGKVNVEDEPEVAEKYGVMSIPTIIIFKNGKEVETLVGIQSKEALVSKLEKYY